MRLSGGLAIDQFVETSKAIRAFVRVFAVWDVSVFASPPYMYSVDVAEVFEVLAPRVVECAQPVDVHI